MNFKIGKALVMVTALLAGSSQASVAHLTLTGTPGDYISQGQNVDNVYSSADPLLVWNNAQTYGPDWLRFVFLYSNPYPNGKFTTMDFSTRALGTDLTVGTTYLNAERAAFASPGHAGLDVSYNHRGCNTLRGSFTVKQLSYKAGALDTFGASFSQSCDGGAFMNGTFYYNASLTALPSGDVPEPAMLALLGLGLAGLGVARRRKRAE